MTQSINENLKEPKSATIYRIDEDNANPLRVWDKMNKPIYPTMEQMQTLNESSKVIGMSIKWNIVELDIVQFNVMIPSYGVAMIDIQY